MSTWHIPAKTFLIGEYLALKGGPAIILTTMPCFELSFINQVDSPFHPDSPAGRFCRDHQLEHRLSWFDPYGGLGGLGASSAEFVGSFYAYCELTQRPFNAKTLLETYWHYTGFQEGQRPSGYDVIAQTMHGCVMLHQALGEARAGAWPFDDIDFILIHTRHKLRTHEHLKAVRLEDEQVSALHEIASAAWDAFAMTSSATLVDAVNAYSTTLQEFGLVADTTFAMMNILSREERPLAIKGCGALGSDVILMLVERARSEELKKILKKKNYTVLASSEDLFIDNLKNMKKNT